MAQGGLVTGCGDILDVNAFPLHPLPKAIQGVSPFAFADVEDTPAFQINHDGLVNVPFPDGKLIYAYAVRPFQRRRRIMTFKMAGVYVLDRVPCHTKQVGGVLQGHGFQKANNVFRKTMGVAATARGKGDILLPVIVTVFVLALVTLHLHADYHLLAADRKTYEVTNAESVLDQMTMAALGTCLYASFRFDMQDNCITFVFLTRTFVVIKTPYMI